MHTGRVLDASLRRLLSSLPRWRRVKSRNAEPVTLPTLAELETRYETAGTRAAVAQSRRDARRIARALGLPVPAWALTAVCTAADQAPLTPLAPSGVPVETRAWAARTGGRIGCTPDGFVLRGPVVCGGGVPVDRIFP